jgi:hypothetical protein
LKRAAAVGPPELPVQEEREQNEAHRPPPKGMPKNAKEKNVPEPL